MCYNPGLYLREQFGEGEEPLYIWAEHGISVSDVIAIQVTGDQCIRLIYADSKGANLLRLEPTDHVVEVQDITFAVSPDRRGLIRRR